MHLQRQHKLSDTGALGLHYLPLSILRLCELQRKFAYRILYRLSLTALMKVSHSM